MADLDDYILKYHSTSDISDLLSFTTANINFYGSSLRNKFDYIRRNHWMISIKLASSTLIF